MGRPGLPGQKGEKGAPGAPGGVGIQGDKVSVWPNKKLSQTKLTPTSNTFIVTLTVKQNLL